MSEAQISRLVHVLLYAQLEAHRNTVSNLPRCRSSVLHPVERSCIESSWAAKRHISRGAGPSNYTCQAHIDLLHGSQWSCVRGAGATHRLGGLSKSCRSANKMIEAWPADGERLFAMSATYSSFPKHEKTGRPWQQNTMESTADTRDLRGAARSLSASISDDC